MMYYSGKYGLVPAKQTHKNIGKLAMVIAPLSEDFRCVGQVEYISDRGIYKICFCGNWIGWYDFHEIKIMN